MYHTFFQVRGQLENETWSNIGVVWKPNTVNADDNVEGGLTVRKHLSQGYLTPSILVITMSMLTMLFISTPIALCDE